MSGGGDAEPTATKVQQSSWIQLDSIVIAALVFGIGLVVVVVVNLLLEESRSDIQLYHTHPNQELVIVLYSSRRDRTISGITVQALIRYYKSFTKTVKRLCYIPDSLSYSDTVKRTSIIRHCKTTSLLYTAVLI